MTLNYPQKEDKPRMFGDQRVLTKEEARRAVKKMVGETLRTEFLPGLAFLVEQVSPEDVEHKKEGDLLLEAAREITRELMAGEVVP